jgi:guanylate kinase
MTDLQEHGTEGLLVIISGPSGSGKGTVVKRLEPAMGYALSISVTTRSPRPGEMDKRDYFFTTEKEFTRMRRDNELLEHAVYVGHYYGTPRKYAEEQIAKGKVVVLEIEVNGALQVKEKFPQAVLIFLMPPTLSELSRRLTARKTEDSVTIEDRLKRASDEVDLIYRYDYLVVNDEVEKALEKINHIVAAERLRPERKRVIIENFRDK